MKSAFISEEHSSTSFFQRNSSTEECFNPISVKRSDEVRNSAQEDWKSSGLTAFESYQCDLQIAARIGTN